MTIVFRVPAPRPPGRGYPRKVRGTSAGATAGPGRNAASSSRWLGARSEKFGRSGRTAPSRRTDRASRTEALQTASPGAIGRIAVPKGSPQEVSGSPGAIGRTASRWPSRTVWGSRLGSPEIRTRVPASRRRNAMATLSPGPGSRATASRSAHCSVESVEGRKARGGDPGQAGPRGSRSATSAFSSFSSFSVAAIFDLLNSLTGTPGTICQREPSLRIG